MGEGPLALGIVEEPELPLFNEGVEHLNAVSGSEASTLRENGDDTGLESFRKSSVDTRMASDLSGAAREEDAGPDHQEICLPAITYQQISPPAVASSDCRSVVLHWETAREELLGDGSETEDTRERPKQSFVLELQQVGTHRTPAAEALQRVADDSWAGVYSGEDCTVMVSGLMPGMAYAVRLRCLLEQGDSDVVAPLPSDAILCQTVPCTPSAPNPVVLSGKERRALKLKWPVPEETGGFDELQYTLEICPPPLDAMHQLHPQGFCAVYQGEKNSVKVAKLAPGVKYLVRVAARNELGYGPYSNVGEFKTEASVPSQPYPPSCCGVGPASVWLHWPPAQCNGADITRYIVQKAPTSDPGNWEVVYAGQELSCEIRSLQTAERYLFRLGCENDIGKSVFSSPLEVRTASSPPGQPSSIGVDSVTRTTAFLKWHPPSWDGGEPVIHYEVQLYPKSAAALVGGLAQQWFPVFQGLETTCTVHGLRGGCTYRAQVRGFNLIGAGDFSQATEFTTAPEAPEGLPPPVISQCTQGGFELVWEPPQFDGGAPINVYTVECWDVAQKLWMPVYRGLTTGCNITGLLPGTEYFLRVGCANSHGDSPWSIPCSGRTAAAPPSPPKPPMILSTSGSGVVLSWKPPPGNGLPVTGYVLEQARIREDSTVAFEQLYEGPDLSFEVKGLRPFTEYGFRLCASNSAGKGAWGPVAICRTDPGPPGAPDHPEAVTQGVDHIQLRWSAPGQTNGSPVTGYTLELGSVSSKTRKISLWTQIYRGPSNSFCIADLSPGREYAARVRAENGIGVGAFSQPVRCYTSPAPPEAPVGLSVVHRGSKSAKVKWEAPAEDNGSPVRRYKVLLARSDGAHDSALKDTDQYEWKAVYEGPETSARLSGLEPGSQYVLRVLALNSCGDGPACAMQSFATSLAPPPKMEPPAASVGVDSSSGVPKAHLAQIEVRWQPPEIHQRHAAAIGFEVEVTDSRAQAGLEKGGQGPEKGRHLITASKVCLCWRTRVALLSPACLEAIRAWL